MSGRRKRRTSSAHAQSAASKKQAVMSELDFDTSDDDDDDAARPPVLTGGSFGWRMDPEESLSDWTIEIVYDQNDGHGVVSSKTDTYHVHKCHLATGPQKSGYFGNLFSEGGRFSEAQDKKSRIELHELAAKAFPDLLDYFYGMASSPKITTENATALSFLTKYFDMPQLQWTVKQFWKQDVKSAIACGTYYEHAKILHRSKILTAAIQACSDNILDITTTSRLLHVPDTAFWLKLVESSPPAGPDTIMRSRHFSKLIATFCCNVDVDKEDFEKLTSMTSLPQIDVEAALFMLDAERRVMTPDDTALTPLQERCIACFARNGKRVDLLQSPKTLEMLHKQNSRVLTQLFARSLKMAVAPPQPYYQQPKHGLGY